MDAKKKLKPVHIPLCIITGIMILLVLFSGCLDLLTDGSSDSGGGSSGSCRSGSHIYSTSEGHCCPEGYPYYYDGTCHTCSRGYYKYDTSAGYCCPEGYSQYYDGKCHQCSRGYYKYDTSGGHCCPEGYPYYYDGTCHSRSSGTTVIVNNNAPVDANTGCPAQRDLKCSGWIPGTRCSIQSCTCYFSGTRGDSATAYYHTSDGAYFRCTGAGQTINCIAAAEAAAQHCT